MSDAAHFLTPEMFALLVNNGLGGIAVILLFQVNTRLGKMAIVDDDHERRLRALELRVGFSEQNMERK